MTLYTYRTGDDVCTPFKTDDPVIAAGLYADENGAGQVFVVVGDRIEEYDVSGECDAWIAEHIGSHRAPVGWRREGSGWAIGTPPKAEIVVIAMAGRVYVNGACLASEPRELLSLYHKMNTSGEAVLRMAAHVAWGGRDGGEERHA